MQTRIFGFLALTFLRRRRKLKTCMHRMIASYCQFLNVNDGLYFSLKSLFRGVHLDLDDDAYVYEVNTKDSLPYYRLHEVYKVNDEGDPIIRQIGRWSRGGSSDSSLYFMKEEKNSRRRDLRVSTFINVITTNKEKGL